jgi:Fe-S-cluster-containing dehydrogenase component
MSENQSDNGQTPNTEDRFLTRREFVAMLTTLGASLAVATALSEIEPLEDLIQRELALELPQEVEHETSHGHATTGKHRWGMVIDLSKCIGCQYCVYACQAVNDVTDDMRWNEYLADTTETGEVFHMTRPCLHCQDAPCVAVCPVQATYVREDGIVMMDYDVCIGCRYCQVACPYGARSFNWEQRLGASGYQEEWGDAEIEHRPRGVPEKCTFCVHRIDRGLPQGLIPGIDAAATPACVNICPVNARIFGDLNDPHSPVSVAIAENPTIRLREDLGTEPNVYYIPPEGMAL